MLPPMLERIKQAEAQPDARTENLTLAAEKVRGYLLKERAKLANRFA